MPIYQGGIEFLRTTVTEAASNTGSIDSRLSVVSESKPLVKVFFSQRKQRKRSEHPMPRTKLLESETNYFKRQVPLGELPGHCGCLSDDIRYRAAH